MKRNSLINCIPVLGLIKTRYLMDLVRNCKTRNFIIIIFLKEFFVIDLDLDLFWCLFGGWKLRGNVCIFRVIFWFLLYLSLWVYSGRI
jgi:hypothetical protein